MPRCLSCLPCGTYSPSGRILLHDGHHYGAEAVCGVPRPFRTRYHDVSSRHMASDSQPPCSPSPRTMDPTDALAGQNVWDDADGRYAESSKTPREWRRVATFRRRTKTQRRQGLIPTIWFTSSRSKPGQGGGVTKNRQVALLFVSRQPASHVLVCRQSTFHHGSIRCDH